jgi:hypothetical protein
MYMDGGTLKRVLVWNEPSMTCASFPNPSSLLYQPSFGADVQTVFRYGTYDRSQKVLSLDGELQNSNTSNAILMSFDCGTGFLNFKGKTGNRCLMHNGKLVSGMCGPNATDAQVRTGTAALFYNYMFTFGENGIAKYIAMNNGFVCNNEGNEWTWAFSDMQVYVISVITFQSDGTLACLSYDFGISFKRIGATIMDCNTNSLHVEIYEEPGCEGNLLNIIDSSGCANFGFLNPDSTNGTTSGGCRNNTGAFFSGYAIATPSPATPSPATPSPATPSPATPAPPLPLEAIIGIAIGSAGGAVIIILLIRHFYWRKRGGG